MYKISNRMSGKLEGIPALNTSPVNNEFCQKMSKTDSICQECYSMRMLKTFRKNAEAGFRENGEYLSELIIPLALVPRINSAFFRISAHGELINENHLINCLNLAVKNPHCTFALWTKRKDIVNRVMAQNSKPDNMIFVYSESRVDFINENIPEHFDKIFNVVSEDTPEEARVNCGGKKCIDCLACYTKAGANVLIERKKSTGTHNKKKHQKERDG